MRSVVYAQVVGRRNYRYFVCFVVSVTSLSAFVCISCGWVVYLRSLTIDPCAADSLHNETDATTTTHAAYRPPKHPPAGTIDPPTAAGDAGDQPDPWCHDDFLTNLIEAIAAEPMIAGLSIYAGAVRYIYILMGSQSTPERCVRTDGGLHRNQSIVARVLPSTTTNPCVARVLSGVTTNPSVARALPAIPSPVSDRLRVGCFPQLFFGPFCLCTYPLRPIHARDRIAQSTPDFGPNLP